jgi:hypothetical protein
MKHFECFGIVVSGGTLLEYNYEAFDNSNEVKQVDCIDNVHGSRTENINIVALESGEASNLYHVVKSPMKCDVVK